MAIVLDWSPTKFDTEKFNVSRRYLRKTATGTLAVSAGRTWTMCSIDVGEYLGYYWHPFRWSMGSVGTPRNFVAIHPDGGSIVNRSDRTPAVNPTIITAVIG